MNDFTPDSFKATLAEVEARKARLHALLAECPLTDVYGVVHPSGTGTGSRTGGSGSWSFSLTLEPWRKAGEACQFTSLIACQEASKEEISGLIRTFSAHDVVHLKLQVLEKAFMDDCPERRDALLVEIVNTKFQDDELAQHARELKKPKYYRDANLGKLTLDRSLDRLETKRWKGFLSRYTIHIERDGQTYDSRQAWEKIQFVESHLDAIRSAIVEHLFDTYDSSWESLGKLTPARFAKRPKLRSVTVETDGRVRVRFGDSGLFLGHDIVVSIDENQLIDSTYLEG